MAAVVDYTRSLADEKTHWSVTQFLYREAEMLDTRRYREWTDLLTEDFVYQVPVQVTRDNPTLSPYAEDAFVVEETGQSIEQLWVKRHEPEYVEYAWGENPRQRTRHFVTNIRVRETETDGEVAVSANVLLSFSRQSDPTTLAAADRQDILRWVNGDWRIARRVVYLDQTVIELTHMRLLF